MFPRETAHTGAILFWVACEERSVINQCEANWTTNRQQWIITTEVNRAQVEFLNQKYFQARKIQHNSKMLQRDLTEIWCVS